MGRRLAVVDGAPAGPAPEPDALAREGWARRFMAAGQRVEEAAALYRRLGYAVRLERPTAADLREECGECRLALALFRVVYTRRAP